MKVLVTFVILALLSNPSWARDDRLSYDCLVGKTDPRICCKGVPDAWYAHLRNPANCSTFFQCTHGAPVLKPCPPGLEWSVENDRCEWPFSANCLNPTTKSPDPTRRTTHKPTTKSPDPTPTRRTTSKPSTPTPDPPTPFPTTTTPFPTTTTPFPTTTTPTPTTQTTPTPTTPDPDHCTPSPICKQCLTGEFPAELCCKGVRNWQKIYLGNPHDCSSYYMCVNQHAKLKWCPRYLRWSVKSDRCEHPEHSECES